MYRSTYYLDFDSGVFCLCHQVQIFSRTILTLTYCLLSVPSSSDILTRTPTAHQYQVSSNFLEDLLTHKKDTDLLISQKTRWTSLKKEREREREKKKKKKKRTRRRRRRRRYWCTTDNTDFLSVCLCLSFSVSVSLSLS